MLERERDWEQSLPLCMISVDPVATIFKGVAVGETGARRLELNQLFTARAKTRCMALCRVWGGCEWARYYLWVVRGLQMQSLVCCCLLSGKMQSFFWTTIGINRGGGRVVGE